ncbi:MAG TPA: lipocalin-like domain-containing protein [Terriglobales bacterium]|nr:lipocalin-like domain-containing protein [Terriglobales bacterium]
MHFRRFFAWLIACLVVAQVLSSAEEKSPAATGKDEFVGAWQLVRVETIRPNGEIIYPFYGKHPQGLIVYDASGWMSVQIVSDPQPNVPKADSREEFLSAPASEKAAAIDGYYAYWGRWTVDTTKGTITHHIEQSLYPAERGEDGVRHFVIEGDKLTLTADTNEMGERHQRKLVWRREPESKR